MEYIKDIRTATRVTVGVVAGDGRVRVTSAIEGEYLRSHVIGGVQMECVSTGRLERVIVEKISSM